MTNKKVVPIRIDPVDPPPHICAECWYYETQTHEHGSCFALPPVVLFDNDGDFACPRPIVMSEDKGCIHWKARFSA